MTTPVTPLLVRDAPVLPERTQGCGIPLRKKAQQDHNVESDPRTPKKIT